MVKPYPNPSPPKVLDLYRSTKERIMHQIFSNCETAKELADKPSLLRTKLPLFFVERAVEHPLGVSLYLLAKDKEGLSHYFFTLCSTSLIPGQITALDRFFASCLRLEGIECPLTLIESYVVFRSQAEFVQFNEHLDRFMEEVKRGCEKEDIAERTFERKKGGANQEYLQLQDLFSFFNRRLPFHRNQLEKFLRRFWVEFNERIEADPAIEMEKMVYKVRPSPNADQRAPGGRWRRKRA